jgi:histidinol-phosphate aminotransferase
VTAGWRNNLIRLDPYRAGEQPKSADVIKLNANENPYPPAPGVYAAVRGLECEGLRRYPSADGGGLRRALAAYHGLDEGEVFVGNGSDEILALAFRAFFNSGSPVLFPDVTYSFYPVWCRLFGIAYETRGLAEDFSARVDDYKGENGGVVLANPNAPTGVCLPDGGVERLMRRNGGASVVIIDEAYIDFGGVSSVGLVREFENLLVVQTFSKGRALAGMRLGMAFGSPALISVLEAVKNSFNSYPVDSVAEAAGIASIEDDAYFRARAGQVAATRDRVAGQMRGMGFRLTDSRANFLFAAHPDIDAEALKAHLGGRGILVRHFRLPGIERHLRISVGTDAEMDALLEGIREFMECFSAM